MRDLVVRVLDKSYHYEGKVHLFKEKFKILREVASYCSKVELQEIEIYVQPARSFETDSDTEESEGLNDREIINPFTRDEMVLLKDKYKKAHANYHKAHANHFENAWGKFFITSFLDLLTLLDSEIKILHSTGSSGQTQPGYTTIIWSLDERESRQATPEPVHQHTVHQRYPDFIAFKGDQHFIVGEIMSTTGAAISQNTEQMTGLFRQNQNLMLGLAIWPDKVTPQFFYQSLSTNDVGEQVPHLYLHKLTNIVWASPCALEKLFDLCASFTVILNNSRAVSE